MTKIVCGPFCQHRKEVSKEKLSVWWTEWGPELEMRFLGEWERVDNKVLS